MSEQTSIVVFENENFLAINKPAGWVVNDSKTAHGNPTVQNWVSTNYDFEIANSDELRNGIVHRLDKETSGVLLIAKNEVALKNLQSQFEARTVQKEYQTLVHGKLIGGGTITGAIARMPKQRTRFGVMVGGREAETQFTVDKKLSGDGGEYSLLTARPKTGRTHQIRVHFSHVNHPVVSDPIYGGKHTYQRDKVWCPRLFLHAKKITIQEPITGEALVIEAPIPQDLQSALSTLH